MKTILFAGCALLSALALSACATNGASASDATNLVTALGNAGCSGSVSVNIHVGTAAGVSPGSANFDNTFTGTCDPSKAKPTAAPTPQ